MNKLFYCLVAVLFLFPASLCSQGFHDFGFSRKYFSPPVIRNADSMALPWLGGLNACQFSATDMNMDGVKDLLVFDRIGNRLLPFLNGGNPGTTDLTYAPEYVQYYPALKNWMLMKDYNLDGLDDIFTYGFGGIAVYRNVATGSVPAFELVTNQLLSLIYSNYLNIFVTDVDYPGIADMDQDGDLDILCFWIIGTYVHYHRNLSMEKYGNADSLDFRLESNCWGFIREGDTSNSITLNAICPSKEAPLPGSRFQDNTIWPEATEHIGSTFEMLDLNGDGLTDMLIGDVDYPQIIALYNAGSLDTALVTSIDAYFPSYDTSINVFSFPVACYLDVDNDNKKDLLVSPFDPNTNISESSRSVWLYKNSGTDPAPLFHLQTKAFLQEDMIDAGTCAFPVVVDFDQDGLDDLVVGNFGYHDSSYYEFGFLRSVFRSRLMALRNTGTATEPAFSLTDDDFASVSFLKTSNVFPSFGDLDGDQDMDMVLGRNDGTLVYYENVAGSGNPFLFGAPLLNYQGIDVGLASAPQIFDLDRDGLSDLIIGSKSGFFHYFRNTGTSQQAQFTLVTDSLGHVDVRNIFYSWDGYSTPCFFRLADDTTRLFAGSLVDGLCYYKNIDGNLGGTFLKVDHNYLFVKEGDRNAFAVNDFDQDNYPDLVMGLQNGGLAYFKGTSPAPIGIAQTDQDEPAGCKLYPNPSQGEFTLLLQTPLHYHAACYRIFNLQGTVVKQGSIPDFPVRMSLDLPAGMYLLKVFLYGGDGKWRPVKPEKLFIFR